MSKDDRVAFEDLPDEIKRILSASTQFRMLHDELGARTKQAMDRLATAARSLLIAHGAAIIASLQIISQNQSSRLTNVNFFCAIFCYGFILSMVANFFAYYVLDEVNSRHWEEKKIGDFRAYLWLTAGPTVISFCILVISVAKIGHDVYRW